MVRHFINLTNGIEAIPVISEPYAFIRIQSTACEQKRWDFVLQDLDYTFLLALASGETCVVYDYGANKPVPRALYQGVEWVRYALTRRWLGVEITPIVRGRRVLRYFRECYGALDKRTFAKIDYVRKFLNTDEIRIELRTGATQHDGDYDYYARILREAA